MTIIQIDSDELARLVGMTRRGARKLLQRHYIYSFATWLGTHLEVSLVPSIGGKSGQKYKAAVRSLPANLQTRLNDLQRPVEGSSAPRDAVSAEANKRLNIIAPIVAHPKHTAEWRAARKAVFTKCFIAPDGTSYTIPETTLRRWEAEYRAHGIRGLIDRTRRDKGTKRAIISTAAERAIPFETEAWQGIAAELRTYIRGHWKAGVTLKLIRGRANIKFRELIEAAGFAHCHTLPESTFNVPRAFIEAERHFGNVAIFRKDRKRFDDEQRFRITRSRAGLLPMDWVVGDVHPVDIVMTRDDGSTAHARMIAWLDVATNRIWFDLVLCEASTGIRNKHLIQSFLRMVAAWGMPKTLYIDNGKEYLFADKLNDALQLVAQLSRPDGRTVRIVRALPFDAPAKPIESMFRAVERLLQHIPGHTGGDRMNKKTENVGCPTKAYPGTLESLQKVIAGLIAHQEILPMRGALKGRTPNQVLQAAIDAGWGPVALDPRQVLMVFASDRVCTIRQQAITFDNRKWTCDELDSYFEEKIIARVPDYWSASKLALLHIKTRELIGIAEPVPIFAFDDPAGAKYSAAKGTRRRKAIIALDRSTPTIDTVAEGLRIAAHLPPAPSATPIASIGLSDQAATIAAAMVETPAARADKRHREAQARTRKQAASALAFAEKLERAKQ
jgi:hypothetical protein